MKNLLTASGGKLELDEQANRLILTLSNARIDPFKKLVDHSVKAVHDYQIKECLVDAQNRDGASQESNQYALSQFKKAMNQGLERMAIVNPHKEFDKEITDKFVENIGSDSVRAFSNRRDALEWLNSQQGQVRRAA